MLEKVRSMASRSDEGTTTAIIRGIFRFLQCIVALVVIGFYGRDVSASHKANVSVDGRWALAVAVGGLSFVIAIVLAIPKIPARKLWPLDAVIWLLWLVVFGIFANMFAREDCEGNGGCERMKTAMWFDLIGFLLWTATVIMGIVLWRKAVKMGIAGSVV